jgi:hypothetical protein
MNTREFASQLKALIQDIRSKGTAAIYCDNLIAYLNEVQKSPEAEPSAIEIEKYKADLQNAIEANKHTHERDLEMFRSVITAGQSAMKSSFLLNGGSAVALLAFIGHLAQFKPTKVPEFGACLLPFAFGVLAITMTSGFTYLSQWLFASQRPAARKTGFGFNITSICFGFASYGLFVWGLIATYRVLAAYT